MIIEKLNAKLLNLNANFEIIRHNKPIKSKSDAISHFKIEETAPTLIISTETGFYALIISGERNKMDFNLIRHLDGLNKVRLADKMEIFEKLNIIAGQAPLVGHDLPCIIDNFIFKHEFIYGGTGDLHFTLKIKPDDLVRANNIIYTFG